MPRAAMATPYLNKLVLHDGGNSDGEGDEANALRCELEGDAHSDGEGKNGHDGGLHAKGKTCAYDEDDARQANKRGV